MLRKLFNGYISLAKEIFCIENQEEFFELELNLWSMTTILGLIGLLRNVLEVLLKIRIHPKWYVLDIDINFTMFFFPIYFCFFGSFIIHLISRFFNQRVPYERLISLTFYLQFLHLLVPFIDYIGLKNNVPWHFYLSKPYISKYFTNALVMTLGIIFVWIITAYIMIKVFVKHFEVDKIRGLLVLFLSFNFLYWPIYHIWPSFNTVINLLFSLPNDHLEGDYWGYGMFFMLSSLVGLYYYSFAERIPTPSSWHKKIRPKRKRHKR